LTAENTIPNNVVKLKLRDTDEFLEIASDIQALIDDRGLREAAREIQCNMFEAWGWNLTESEAETLAVEVLMEAKKKAKTVRISGSTSTKSLAQILRWHPNDALGRQAAQELARRKAMKPGKKGDAYAALHDAVLKGNTQAVQRHMATLKGADPRKIAKVVQAATEARQAQRAKQYQARKHRKDLERARAQGAEDERQRAAQAPKLATVFTPKNKPGLDPDYERQLLAARKEKHKKAAEADRKRHQGDLPIFGKLGSAIADMFDPQKKESFEPDYLSEAQALCENLGQFATAHLHTSDTVKAHLRHIRRKRLAREHAAEVAKRHRRAKSFIRTDVSIGEVPSTSTAQMASGVTSNHS